MFAVIAHRRGGSIFGAATAICKEDGKEKFYPTKAEAEAVAKRYNDRTTSVNVFYSVEEMGK